jgi:hypothetical protein
MPTLHTRIHDHLPAILPAADCERLLPCDKSLKQIASVVRKGATRTAGCLHAAVSIHCDRAKTRAVLNYAKPNARIGECYAVGTLALAGDTAIVESLS